MKKTQLQQIIREELRKTLKEYTVNNLDLSDTTSLYGKPVDPALFAKLMPKTAQTVKEAEKRIKAFEGGPMFVHSQVHYVMPKGNREDRPLFYFGQSQYWLRDKEVNVTQLLIEDITEAGMKWTANRDKVKKIGWVLVDTKVFLNELNTAFEIVKTSS